MFLRPSHSLNARIRALLGTRSFASSRDEIGPRGHVVPVLDRIRRRTLHRGISFLATRTAKLFVVVQRVMLKVSLLRARCASSFTRDDRVFSLRKKRQTFPRWDFIRNLIWCCVCLSFGTHHSPGLSVFSPNNAFFRLFEKSAVFCCFFL